MTTEHRCPLCNSPLWPHASGGHLGWFCRHCEQKVPYSVDPTSVNKVSLDQPISSSQTPQLLTPPVPQTFTLREILQTTVDGIAQFLQADRVLIAQMMPSGEMVVVEEWRQRPWKTLLHCHISQFVTLADIKAWQQGKVEAIADLRQQNEQTATTMALDSLFDVRAKVIVPIRQRDSQTTSVHPLTHSSHQPHVNHGKSPQSLWGLIIIHQCSGPRQWTASELGFLSLLSTQLIISIQQDHFYQHLNQINQKLEAIAFQDRLTQIPNRHYFEHYFAQEWRRMAREKQPLSLILCDVDFFKAYNDTFGHPQGDRCLQEIAHTLKYTLHRPGDMVARYGGEEFVIILPNTKASGAIHVAQQMRSAIKRLKMPSATQKVSEYVTVSLGVASVIPSQEMSPKQLLNEADQALYEAKEKGRDQLFFRGEKELKLSPQSTLHQPTLMSMPLLDNLSPSDLLKSYVGYFLSRGISVSSPIEGILPFDGLVYQYQGYHHNFLDWWRQLETRTDYTQLSLSGDTHRFQDFLEGDYGVQECALCNLPIATPTGHIYGLPHCTLCLNDQEYCQRKETEDGIKSEPIFRLLVMTDTQDNLKTLQQWLNSNQVEAIFLDNLTEVNKYLLSESFSAIIIDNHLDEETIENWVKQLHQYPSLQEIPMIALSEKAGNGIPWLNRKLKLEDYVLTPFNGDKLVNYLRNLSANHTALTKTDVYWFPR
ncbi:MAG: sensor domain-containing diguanylate cyclase [Crocosphaera sp.]|nr:sensor domain-containing diguanylate cyclase [Crocosphaera sp.]